MSGLAELAMTCKGDTASGAARLSRCVPWRLCGRGSFNRGVDLESVFV